MDNSGLIYITVNGESIQLRFGIYATRLFLERMSESNNSMMVGDSSINETGIANLLECGYLNSCIVNDVAPVRKLGFFVEFVETAFVDDEAKAQLEAVSACYANSKYSKKLLETVIENDAKKKAKKKVK